ncbi:MAG TPA: hypothetical protein VG890_10970 [Puia sp.]|nr:hypothetical protein [Puia sp.]
MQIQSFLFTSFLLISFGLNSSAQTQPVDLSHIKSVFNKINSNTRLTKVTLENEEFSDQTPDGGASLTGYFDKNSLVKISFWIGLSYGIRQTDFYFDNDSLVFCYVTERHFKTGQTTIDYTKTELAFEGRYYYNNSHLLLKKTAGTGFQGKDNEDEIIPDSRQYFKLLMQKMNRKKH